MKRKKIVSLMLVFVLLISGMGSNLLSALAAPANPPRIEAEDYIAMSGIEVEVCSEGGLNVGFVDGGDWMDYTAPIPESGVYSVSFRVSSPYDNTKFQIQSGSTTLASLTVPNTGGWQNWVTITAPVVLNAGSQTLRIYAVTNGWNLNWLEFSYTSPSNNVDIPVTGSYAQYIEMGISPADLNGKASLKTQNTDINHTLRYAVGESVTIRVNYIVEQKQVLFQTTDQGGNVIKGNPLTFTVHQNSSIQVMLSEQGGTAAPVFSPAGGNYTTSQDVSITCMTQGAIIKYTTDGSSPTENSLTYTGPIHIATTTTIKAVAMSSGQQNSSIVTASYYIGSQITNLALGKNGRTSSYLGGNIPMAAFDGNEGTRWESEFSDPQWIYVDLENNYWVKGVKLNWEVAGGKAYIIQISKDASHWEDAYTRTNGSGGMETLSFEPIEGRYVRMYGTERTTPYGYSLWEFEVYGDTAPPLPKAEPPVFSKNAGVYTNPIEVELTSNTSGAVIRYTTDGTMPTENSQIYQTPLRISQTTTIRAITTKSGMANSNVSEVTYTIVGFMVTSPINERMITDTRTPLLTWEPKQNAVRYEVWINLSRTDYDWNAPGNLLDRYTKVAEVTDTKCNAPTLVDRWTYKWYVIAVEANGTKVQSDIGQFSVYLPYIEQMSDGVNIINGMRDLNKNGTIEPYEDWHNTISVRVNDLMSRMSSEEKINQLFYSPESLTEMNKEAGFVFSYGTTDFIRDAQLKIAAEQRLGIPIIFAGDKIQGWKTVFPTELGLAATRNLDLAWKAGDLQRREQKAWGFTGTLSPVAEVDTKVLYPRFQEGGGENADYVAAMMRAMICGMQGGPEVNPKSIMTTVKHWPSQGAGGEQAIVYDSDTINWHMKPWYAALDANCATIMPGYGGSSFLDPAGEGAGTSKPTIDYLRNILGFDGVVVTDWLMSATDISVKSISAGCDVMGGAVASGTDFNTLINTVGWNRLNEAVRRVVELKFRMGLFENPYGDPDYPTSIWHSPDSQNIVNEAARQSLTLLKNNGVLPLKLNSGDTLVVTGPRATSDDMASDNIANVIWQSIYHDNPQAKSYYQGIKDRAGAGINVVLGDAAAPKAAVVVIGERSYTHGTEWENKSITIPEDQTEKINEYYRRGIPVIAVIVMPRPYVLTDILDKCSAIVIAYRPGNGGGMATAQLLFGDFSPTGRLPFQLPRSVEQVGTDNVNNQLEKWDLPYDLGATAQERAEIRNYIRNGQPVPANYGNPLFPYGYGLQNFTPSS